MKIVLGLIAIAMFAGIGGFFFLAQQSKNGVSPGVANGVLLNGVLTPCPASPNCVCSEAGTPESHAVDALPLSAWEKLPSVIEAQGGKVVAQVVANDEAYLAATFRSRLFGFVDDVEFRKAEDGVHVRSASRVGHSDMGANAKRVESLRAALSAPSAS